MFARSGQRGKATDGCVSCHKAQSTLGPICQTGILFGFRFLVLVFSKLQNPPEAYRHRMIALQFGFPSKEPELFKLPTLNLFEAAQRTADVVPGVCCQSLNGSGSLQVALSKQAAERALSSRDNPRNTNIALSNDTARTTLNLPCCVCESIQ